MKFDDLDKKMRIFETAHDYCIPPGIFIVARLDGRNFTRLTKETCGFEAPFDERFRDAMVETTAQLMDVGFRVDFGYTQSDEISLLFHHDEDAFGRKARKFNSVLAAEASVAFTTSLGVRAVFDCRLSQLANLGLVADYFRWRLEDAFRNSLNAHSYWMLRHLGDDANAASQKLSGMSVAAKNELLFSNGVNFNDLPQWQKRGVGLYWENYSKPGVNPKTGANVMAQRRRIGRDLELPLGDAFNAYVLGFASGSPK